MLFLLRPPQTRLPLRLPRDPAGQAERNQLMMQSYGSTRRVQQPDAGAPPASNDLISSLRALGAMHDEGRVTDEEFAHLKAHLLGTRTEPT